MSLVQEIRWALRPTVAATAIYLALLLVISEQIPLALLTV